MKIPTFPQLSDFMVSILSDDSSEILVLRATYLHLENISQIIEKHKGKYLPLALLIRILRFLVIMMIYADHPPPVRQFNHRFSKGKEISEGLLSSNTPLCPAADTH